MFNSRAQGREIGRRREIVRIDKKRRVQIGGRDLDSATALRTQVSQPYRKTLIGPDFRGSQRGRAEHSVDVWTIGFLHASKEELAASSRSGNRRLRFGNEPHQEAVILKILADTGQIAHNCNAVTA